mgnify:CR=1 FL=1
MELQIVSKQKNPFLKREDISFEITESATTPTRKEVRQKIAALTNAKEDALVVEKIDQTFGAHTAVGNARVYESKQAMLKTEKKYLLDRNFPKPKESATQEKK